MKDGTEVVRSGRISRRTVVKTAAVAVAASVAPSQSARATSPEANPATSAVGDGMTDDTFALNNALATGNRVELERGRTYLVSEPLTLNTAGQVLDGNGAKLKRADQVATNQWFTILVTAPDVHIRGLEIDGNKANFRTYDWATMGEIYVLADRCIIDSCFLHDFPGEGIDVADCADTRISHSTIVNGNGNGVHYGSGGSPGVRGARLLTNHIEDVNQDVAVGHADGCVSISANVSDLLISGNRLKKALAGVGGIDNADNRDITISDNEIRDMSVGAIVANAFTSDSPSNVLIEGNRIYDSQKIHVNQQVLSSTNFPEDFVIRGNLLVNTQIAGHSARYMLIEGNVFKGGDTTMVYIDLARPKFVTLVGNEFRQGGYGFNVGDPFESVQVRDNTFIRQFTRAINVWGTGCTGANAFVANTIVNDSSSSGSYDGIAISAGQNRIAVKSNEIAIVKGNTGISTAGNGTVLQANTVRKGAASNSIEIQFGSTGSWAKYNTTDAAIIDGGTATVIGSNDVIR